MRAPLEVTINGHRGEEYERVCGTRTFPVTSFNPMKADLPGRPNADIYLLNLRLIDIGTLTKIVSHLSKKFGLTEQEADLEIVQTGIPILAEDCSVVLNDSQRWVG